MLTFFLVEVYILPNTHRKRAGCLFLLGGLISFKLLMWLKEHRPGGVEKQDILPGAEGRQDGTLDSW